MGAFGLIATAMLFTCGSAAADKVWSEPQPIVPTKSNAGELALATNNSGAAVLAWIEAGDLRVATRAAGSAQWHSSRRTFADARRPQVSISSKGAVIVAWEQWISDQLFLRAAVRTAKQNWGATATLSGPLGEGQGRWQLSANDRGDALLVWTQYRTVKFAGRPLDQYFVLGAGRAFDAGSWSPAAELSIATSPSVGIDREGNGWAAWQQSDGDSRTINVARFFGGSWSPGTPVASSGEPISEGIQVLVDRHGVAFVAWQEGTGACTLGGDSRLRSVGLLPSLGVWSAPQAVSRPGECPSEPQFGIGSRGGVQGVWNSTRDYATVLRSASTMRADVPWGKPMRLADIGALPAEFATCSDRCAAAPVAFPSLAVNRGGAVVGWVQGALGVRAAVRPPGMYSNGWIGPQLISDRSSRPKSEVVAAMDRRGRGLVVWATKGAIVAAASSPNAHLADGS